MEKEINEKQTAVEWLVKELEEHHVFYDIKNTNAYQIAKQMEKKQIKDAWVGAWKESMINPLEDKYYDPEAEQYYNEKFSVQ